jgi:ribonuclease P protein component
MIPRNMRLSRAHFAPTGPEKRVASPHFSLSLREAEKGGCAVVIGKKVAKLSVTRHLLKRRMASVIAPHCLPSRILIVYARPGAQTLAFPAIKKELEDLLAKALPKSA